MHTVTLVVYQNSGNHFYFDDADTTFNTGNALVTDEVVRFNFLGAFSFNGSCVHGRFTDLIVSADGTRNVTYSDFNVSGDVVQDALDGGLLDAVFESILTGDDRFEGSFGSDIMIRYARNDRMYGGYGYDLIGGGDGNNLIYDGGDSDTIGGGNGDSRLFCSTGQDLLHGDFRDDYVQLATGNDYGYGYGDSGNDLIPGSDGDDRVYGGNGNDFVYGGTGDDKVVDDTGHERIWGNWGDDYLFGGSGGDRMYADPGNDMLYGVEGTDRLYGGSGVDAFTFNTLSGRERFMDFQDGVNVLVFRDPLVIFSELDVSYAGGDALVEVRGVSIIIDDIDVGSLTRSDFEFYNC